MQQKANFKLKDLLKNHVDHHKTTSYSCFFDDAVNCDINLAASNVPPFSAKTFNDCIA